MQVRVVEVAAVTGGTQAPIVHADLTECHAAILIMTLATANGSAANDGVMCIGVAADQDNSTSGPEQACSYFRSNDLADPTEVTGGSYGAGEGVVLALPDATNLAFDCVGTVDEFVTSSSGAGIQISWSNHPGAAYRIKVILFGGSDVRATVNSQTITSGSATDATIGYEPRAVFFVAAEGSTAAHLQGSFGLNGAICFGCAHNGDTLVERSSVHLEDGELDSHFCVSGVWENNPLQYVTTTAALWRRLNTSAFNSSGFSMATTDQLSGDDMAFSYLALEWDASQEFWLGSITSPNTAAPVTQNITGPGFTPEFFGVCMTSVTALSTLQATGDADGFSIGFTDGVASASAGIAGQTGAIAANSASHAASTMIATHQDATALLVQGAFSSFTASGIDINWTTTDPTSRNGWAWAVAEESDAGEFTETDNATVVATGSIGHGYDLHF